MPPQAEQAIVRSFNPELYLGKWYEIARLDNAFEKGLEQVTAHYSLQSDATIKVVNRGFNPQEKKSHEAVGIAKFVKDANADGNRSGKLKVSFFRPFYGEYNILELDQPQLAQPGAQKRDYQYALVSSGRQYLWILSRTPQLDDAIKQQLIAKAKQLGFATEQLLFIRQVNEVENKPG
ncbi:MAG: lipocalin family protein [Methylophilus sp.]|uniref:lipocalin family protein n=1 Tax=Methylophilus sp. TaxID=29541 RepID=UPI003F9EFE82